MRPTSLQEMPDVGPSSLRRLIYITNFLQENRSCSCVSLAKALEVHPRTIRRDMDFLRDECRAPLAWEASTKTWFLESTWEGIGSLRLNSAESFALIIAEQSFRRVRGTPIATALHAILERIADAADGNMRHSWESLASVIKPTPQSKAEIQENRHFASIAKAIEQKIPLNIDYTKPGEIDPRNRTIHPLALFERDQRWAVVAHEPAIEGNKIRKFLLARIENCSPLKTTFDPPIGFDLDSYLDGSVGLFTSEATYHVEAEFSAFAAPYLHESPWHPTQELTSLPDGRVHAAWRVNHLIDIQRKLLSWGQHATVLAPSELVDAFCDIAQYFSEKYHPGQRGGHSVSRVI